MAQLVFVHGVNTRREPNPQKYDDAVADRKRRFKNACFPKVNLDLHPPYWGRFGADPGWNWASIPKWMAPAIALGFDDLNGRVLIAAATHQLDAIVGALSVADLETKVGDPKAAAEAERLWLGAARYAEAVGVPGWLGEVKTDSEFLDRLQSEALAMAPKEKDVVALGFGDSLQGAGRAVLGGLNDLTSGPLVTFARKVATPGFATFIGDVFQYLTENDARALIQKEVGQHIVAAARASQAKTEALILVGHSMGGIILYDMLSDAEAIAPLNEALGFELKADLLLTVGSQVGLFEELKAFRASDRKVGAPAKAPPLKTAALWWNVWDRMDPLGFVAADIFEGVEDFQADTIANVFASHGAYFSSMIFYERLAKRLARAGLAR